MIVSIGRNVLTWKKSETEGTIQQVFLESGDVVQFNSKTYYKVDNVPNNNSDVQTDNFVLFLWALKPISELPPENIVRNGDLLKLANAPVETQEEQEALTKLISTKYILCKYKKLSITIK